MGKVHFPSGSAVAVPTMVVGVHGACLPSPASPRPRRGGWSAASALLPLEAGGRCAAPQCRKRKDQKAWDRRVRGLHLGSGGSSPFRHLPGVTFDDLVCHCFN